MQLTFKRQTKKVEQRKISLDSYIIRKIQLCLQKIRKHGNFICFKSYEIPFVISKKIQQNVQTKDLFENKSEN